MPSTSASSTAGRPSSSPGGDIGESSATVGAGAVQTTGEQGQMRQGEGNAISINGGRPTSNNYTLDGLVNTDTALNTPAVILSQDAIQEFKLITGNYNAEYGRATGAVVSSMNRRSAAASWRRM